MKTGAEFKVVHLELLGSFLIADCLDEAALKAILRAHQEGKKTSRLLKNNLGTIVTRVSLKDEGLRRVGSMPPEIVVKQAIMPIRRWVWCALGGASPFRKDCRIADRLLSRGVLVPRVLAASFRPRGLSEFLITELIAGGVPLRDTLWLGDGVLRGEELAALFRRLGRWLRSIHDSGVWHRDLKPSNVLTRGEDFFLIDITAVRVMEKPLNEERRNRNLAQILDLTADLDGPVRRHLLEAYTGNRGVDLERLEGLVDAAIEARRDYRQSQCGCRYVDEEHQKNLNR